MANGFHMRKIKGGKLQIPVVPLALIGLLCIPAVWAADAMEVALPEITVRNTRPTIVVDNPSPQVQVSAEQIREINAINVEDSLKYVPSLFIRKRYPGDTNSIIATRTTGSVQSAESLVYVDGLLLSNLLGNSFAFPPRWWAPKKSTRSKCCTDHSRHCCRAIRAARPS
jgi:iron complex outermembrane receptor protein